MFGLMGPILVATGYVDGTPLNIQVGSVMGLFGLTMLATSRAGRHPDGGIRPK